MVGADRVPTTLPLVGMCYYGVAARCLECALMVEVDPEDGRLLDLPGFMALHLKIPGNRYRYEHVAHSINIAISLLYKNRLES
jgi:hypothetical protein